MNRWIAACGAGVVGVAVVLAVFLAGGRPRSTTAVRPAVTDSATTTTSASPAPPASASSTLEQEREQVRQAFYAYQDAFVLAGKTLDPTPLAAVAQGQVLDYAQAAIEHARATGQPYLVRVDHTITSIVVTPGLGGPNLGAQVDDTYVDHTVRLDPKTLQPLDADPNSRGQKSYTFQEVSPGVWKATFASDIN